VADLTIAMIIVTGGAGFIGSNVVRGLNRAGHRNILVVDNLQKGNKFVNLVGTDFQDYEDKDDFWQKLRDGREPSGVEAVLHQGACSDTTESDGRYMMRNNVAFSRTLLDFCDLRRIPLIYASSAAVYGEHGSDHRVGEAPLNVYGFSKWVFDRVVLGRLETLRCPVVGLRYFNVYGPGETHKGSMASLVLQWYRQIRETGRLRLFGEYGGFGPGEQRRDFVTVEDVVRVNLWCLAHPELSGVVDVGTGHSRCFNELAAMVIGFLGRGEVEYIPFPEHLRGKYQSHTRAKLERLRKAGFDGVFSTLEQGVPPYLEYLRQQEAHGFT